MKRLIGSVPWYEAIYVAIAVATFKHTAWAYSTTLEGPPPSVDWEGLSLADMWSVGTLLVWYLWGALMAVAVDVSMFYSAREIRRGNKAYLAAFVAAAVFSVVSQLLFAAQHAAPVEIVDTPLQPLQPGGWLWSVLQWRVVILPVSLPLTATLYTLALVLERRQRAQQQAGATYSVRQAADMTGRSYQYILQLANKGIVGRKDDETGRWVLSHADLETLGLETDP